MAHYLRKTYENKQRKEKERVAREQEAAKSKDARADAEAIFYHDRLTQIAENRYGPQAEGSYVFVKSSPKVQVSKASRRVSSEVLLRRQSLFALNEAAGDTQKLAILTGLSPEELGKLLDDVDFDKKIAEHIEISLNLPLDWLDNSNQTVPEATKELLKQSIEELLAMNEEQNLPKVEGSAMSGAPIIETAVAQQAGTAPQEGSSQPAENNAQPPEPKAPAKLKEDPDFPIFCQLFQTFGSLQWFMKQLDMLTAPTFKPFITGVRERNVSKDTYESILRFLRMSIEELREDAKNQFAVAEIKMRELTGMDPRPSVKRGKKKKENANPYFIEHIREIKAIVSGQGNLPVPTPVEAKPVAAPVVAAPPPAPTPPQPQPAVPVVEPPPAPALERPTIEEPIPAAQPVAAEINQTSAPSGQPKRKSIFDKYLLEDILETPLGQVIRYYDRDQPIDLIAKAAVHAVLAAFINDRLEPEDAGKIVSILYKKG